MFRSRNNPFFLRNPFRVALFPPLSREDSRLSIKPVRMDSMGFKDRSDRADHHFGGNFQLWLVRCAQEYHACIRIAPDLSARFLDLALGRMSCKADVVKSGCRLQSREVKKGALSMLKIARAFQLDSLESRSVSPFVMDQRTESRFQVCAETMRESAIKD